MRNGRSQGDPEEIDHPWKKINVRTAKTKVTGFAKAPPTPPRKKQGLKVLSLGDDED
jgi:hypothetical protein